MSVSAEELAARETAARRETWDEAVQHVIASCTYVTSTAEEWRHVRLLADLYEAKAANPDRDRAGLAERMLASADELEATGFHSATVVELRARAAAFTEENA